MSDVSYKVIHNPAEHRFETRVGGLLAVAEYTEDGDRITFFHTYVPPELRGYGIAAQLSRTALDWAREQKAAVVPQCSYFAAYIEKNPGYADLVRSPTAQSAHPHRLSS